MTEADATTAANTRAAWLLPTLAPRLLRRTRPFVLGLSGLQGCGKSTLARALVRQAQAIGWPAVTLSIDDAYLPLRQRMALASRVHPLLRTRGVPGTHDVGLLLDVISRLAHASPTQPVALPRFDKGRDTRRPPSRWPVVTQAPRLIVLEGWCVGLRPQSAEALTVPVNALERREDADGRWRRWVNERLADYAPLWRRLDALWVLQAPDWSSVQRWRAQAERPLRARGAPRAMDAPALRRFMQHYERLSRHALATLPDYADRVIRLDQRHRVLGDFDADVGEVSRPRS